MTAFTEAGRGPALVLLHGFSLNRTLWDPQVEALAGRYRVIAPDLPGLGETPPLPGPEAEVTMARLAQTVLDLLDRLGVDRAAVAGHSMGGYVALALWAAAPQRVAGLGMVCSQAGPDTPEGRQGRFALAEKVQQEGPEAVVGALAPKLFAPAVTPESPLYQAALAMIRQAAPAGIRGALYAMAARPDMLPRLPEIRVPALLLTAAQDRLIPPERSEAMAVALPAAELVKLTVGHMPTLEDPEGTARALAGWLERVYR